MKLRLNYVVPNGEVISTGGLLNPDATGFDIWLDHMVRANPDCIFFYTTETTDIF